MTIETPTNEAVPTEPKSKSIADDNLSFADYQRLRRGEELPASEPEIVKEALKEEAEPDVPEESDEKETDDVSDKDDDSEKEKPKKKGGFQRRIDKLNARHTAAQQEIEHWKAMALKNAASEPKADTKVESKAEANSDEPNPETFDTHTEYVKAITAWTVKKEAKAAKEAENKEKLAEESKTAIQAHLDREKSFKKNVKDYDDVVAEVDDILATPAVTQAIVESDHGPELIYELAKNRAEFERINKLPPLAAARELGKLEAKFATSEEKQSEPTKLTKAPKPIEPVGTGKGAVAKRLDDPNLSFAEFVKLRRETQRRRA